MTSPRRAADNGEHKALEIKHEGVHELVVVRQRYGTLPEWSADTFHELIYKNHIGRWLRNHSKKGPLEEIVRKHHTFTSRVFPSVGSKQGHAGPRRKNDLR